MSRCAAIFGLIVLAMLPGTSAWARILWSDPDARIVHDTGDGEDILGGKVKRR